MKKSLVMLVVLMTSLALAGSVFAMDWGCYEMPVCKPIPCKDKVLCKGKAKGMEKLCGPCAPVIKWSGSWMTIEKCPDSKPAAAKKVAKKAKKK
ncbi:hypothetical protein [Desulfomonile tiedjei]|uniref:Kazal-like domain-containing protein n=1 Tax=Desulfomonile tiedjei (strain ATCC 49306 / DSM 6799 / DCB-1) TaxID=706587 RepID=I4CB48_DESTA|nr:hypothetical protein [Desulfomonile tiedjei]AFM26789.1 hypothetical protein Desti_4152 [Desulfomonile tiedjei DSM 6799]